MKRKLNVYLDKIDGFDKLSLKDQTMALCYFQAGKDNAEFTPSNVKSLFEIADLRMPKNIHQYFPELVDKLNFLISTKSGYKLSRNALKNNTFLNQPNSFGKTKTVSLSGAEKNHIKALECFDSLGIHPAIKRVGRQLFVDKHYPQAILEAFKKINNMVKRKSGRSDLDGKGLMTTVFSKNNPILCLNDFKTTTDIDQQEGYMHIFAGAMLGIRNPKAHDEIVQKNPFITVKLLCLASILAYKIDESRKNKP